MNEILIIGLFALWFASESGIPTYVKNTLFKFGVKKHVGVTVIVGSAHPPTEMFVPIRLYPIDCEKCLAFWIGVLVFPFTWAGIAYACLASLTAIAGKIILNRLR